MLEWSIAAGVGAWIVVTVFLIIALCSGIRLMGAARNSLKQLEAHASELSQQAVVMTKRADQVLLQAQEAAEEIVKWRDTVEQTRAVVEGWNDVIWKWSRRTQSAVESAHKQNERLVKDTLQWVDIGYALWQDVSARKKRSAPCAQSETKSNQRSAHPREE